MNKNEMLKRITEKKTAIEDEIAKRELEKTERLHQLEELILNDYFKRVCDLVEVANAMIKTGIGVHKGALNNIIVFTHYMSASEKKFDFMASGVFHNIGFTHIRNTSEIDGIGIKAGGCLGNRSLYVDIHFGLCVFIGDRLHQRERANTNEDIERMEHFIESFDGFEKEFYDFVEEVTKI